MPLSRLATRNSNPRGPGLGRPESSEFSTVAILPVGVWRELQLGCFKRGEGWPALAHPKVGLQNHQH